MKSIRVYAKYLRIFCISILIPLLIGTNIYSCFFANPNSFDKYHRLYSGVGYSYESSTIIAPFLLRLAVFFVNGVSSAILIWAIIYLIKLLFCFQTGDVFSLNTFSLLKKVNKIFFISVLYRPISHTLLGLITTYNNPPGERILVLMLDSYDAINIFVVGCLFVIVSLMYEGYSIKKDNELTI
jgi:hypothetical protein